MNNKPNTAKNLENQSRIILENNLEESRQLLRKIEEIGGIGHWEVDLVTGKNIWSAQFFHILGLDPGTTPSTELGLSTIHPEDRKTAVDTYQKSFFDGTPYHLEKRIIRPSGEIRFVISDGIVDLNTEGKPIRLFGIFKDVTAEKQKESELKNSNLEIENILDTSHDLIILTDEKGNFRKISKSSLKILGYTSQEMIGKSFRDFIHPSDLEATMKSRRQDFTEKKTSQFTNRYLKADGSVIHLNWSSTLDSTTKTIFAVGRDITQILKTEKDLRSDRKKISLLLNSSPDLIWALDRDYCLITANKAFFKTLGKFGKWNSESGDLLLSEKHFDPEDIHHWKSLYDRAFNGETVTFVQNQDHDGLIQYMEIEIKPVFEEGEILTLACYAKDISKRKEEELKISELVEKLELAQKIGKIGYWEFDTSTNKIFWSEEIYRIWKVDNSFIPDFEKFIESIHPDEREFCLHENIEAIRNKTPLDYTHRIVLPDGEIKYLHEKGSPLLNEVGTLSKFRGTVQDITQRKEAENQIAESNERLAIISKATNDAIWDWNIKTGEHYWGDGFQKLFGIDFEIEGKSPEYWEKRVHPEDFDLVKNNVENLLKSAESTYFESEYRFLKEDGSYTYVSDKGSVIRDNFGNPIRLVGAMQDISHRKEYEESLKLLNEDLAKSNIDLGVSNKELEQFAYVASHDLQEPLRMITSFLGLIEKRYNAVLDEKGRLYIHHAVDGARRMRQIILDLLEFSRVGNSTESKEWVESKSLVEEVILLNQKNICDKKSKIHLEELPAIFCHSSAVVQLFQNLISNAIKYQNPETIPEVWIKGIDSVNFWEFIVKDNGIGIEQEYLTKIFIIFQRLHQKEQYSGSGIGLAICKKIAELHGGKIWVESIHGNGSEFHFTIKK